MLGTDEDFTSAFSITQSVSLIDATTIQNTDGNTMVVVFWTFRDFDEETLSLQLQIIEEFEILQVITEMDLYLAIEFQGNTEHEDQVNDVAMCMMAITQTTGVDGNVV